MTDDDPNGDDDRAAARTVVLLEGDSDRAAVLALAGRRGLDLDGAGIAVVAIGGATSIGHGLGRFGPAGSGQRVCGLVDAAEEPYFRRGLERAGFGPIRSRDDLEAAGFFVCVDDLEDELIRAVGVDEVIGVLDRQGELDSFRIFQRQPAQRSRPVEAQLHRFIGTRSGRKVRYGRLLVEALDTPAAAPRPLDRLLTLLAP